MKAYSKHVSIRIKRRILQATVLIFFFGLLSYQIPNFELINIQYKGINTPRLPKIQYDFPPETDEEKIIREERRAIIKNAFLHAWGGYSKYAWGYDGFRPVSNGGSNKFNGWGATIVDNLDTMWIMNLMDEFNKSREFVSKLHFTNNDDATNVFETIIRYLGGFISAFEFSKDPLFLEKATEIGTALLVSFNSTTGLPYNNAYLNPKKWNYNPPWGGGFLSEVGSSCLEYTKLAELTGKHEFFSMVDNITQILQNAKKSIPGLFPIKIDQETGEFISNKVSFGAFGDSFYEYLIKEYILVGGTLNRYRNMYIEAIESMKKYLIKESPVKERPDLLFIGELSENNNFIGKMGHLSCFVPGMLAIGSKFLNRPGDLKIATRLAETCYWSNRITKTGIGAEEVWFKVVDKENNEDYTNENVYLDGIEKLNPSYSLLRPETIESLFILYRITGDKKYQEKSWDIWQSIEKWCKTPTGYSGLNNVNFIPVSQNDDMESFFLAETLKYLYLLFSPPDLISLDTYVFSTEAHPFMKITENLDFFAKP